MENEVNTLSLAENEEHKLHDTSLNDSQVSPFSKSRYGRTRKPKISQDFYTIDVLFDAVKDARKNVRASQQIKSPLSGKMIKSKSNISLNEDHTPKKDAKFMFIHVTGDSELDDLSKPLDTMQASPCEPEDIPEPTVTNSSSEVLSLTSLNNTNILGVYNNSEIVVETTGIEETTDVMDSNSNTKPTLKTYINRRKCCSKLGMVESFALPDKPIFSADSDAPVTNDSKRCKDLDVALTSETDINLLDKNLLNTPWKIASINTDMNTSETLLDPVYGEASEDDIALPTNSCDQNSSEPFTIESSLNKAPLVESLCIQKENLHAPTPNDNNKANQIESNNPIQNNDKTLLNENLILSQSKHKSHRKSHHQNKTPHDANKEKSKSEVNFKGAVTDLTSKSVNSTNSINTSTTKSDASNKKTVPKTNILAIKKKGRLSSGTIKKIFEEPLFSIPDATIRQVPIKSKSNIATTTKQEPKEKSKVQDVTKENTSNIKQKTAINEYQNIQAQNKEIPSKQKIPKNKDDTSTNDVLKNLKEMASNKESDMNKKKHNSKVAEEKKDSKSFTNNVSAKINIHIPDISKESHKKYSKSQLSRSSNKISKDSQHQIDIEEPIIPTKKRTKTGRKINENKQAHCVKAHKEVTKTFENVDNRKNSNYNSMQDKKSAKILQGDSEPVVNESINKEKNVDHFSDNVDLLKEPDLNKDTPQITDSLHKLGSDSDLVIEKVTSVQKRQSAKEIKVLLNQELPYESKDKDNVFLTPTNLQELPLIIRKSRSLELMITPRRLSKRNADTPTSSIKNVIRSPISTNKIVKSPVSTRSSKKQLPIEIHESISNIPKGTESVNINIIPKIGTTPKKLENSEDIVINSTTLKRGLENSLKEETPIKRPRGRPKKIKPAEVDTFSVSLIELTDKNVRRFKESDDVDILKQTSMYNRRRRATSLCCISKDLHESPKSEKLSKRESPIKSLRKTFQSKEKHSSKIPEKKIATRNQRAASVSHFTEISIKKSPTTIEVKKTSVKNLLDSKSIEVGDLVWGRIGNYPFWPCLITTDPDSSTFQKHIGNNKVLFFHVRFYGDKGRRCWISSAKMMKFKSKNDLVDIAQHMSKANLQPFTVKPQYKISWDTAVAEAISMQPKTVKERLEFFLKILQATPDKKRKLSLSISNYEDIRTPKLSKLNTSKKESKYIDARHVRAKSLPPSPKRGVEEKPFKNYVKSKTLSEFNKLFTSPLPKFAQTNIKNSVSALMVSDESRSSSVKSCIDDVKLEKKDIDKMSECSLSDSEAGFKSTSTTIVPNVFQDLIMRHKRNNIFKGVSKHRVCQICTKPGEVLKCQGPCCGIFHYSCAKAIVFQQTPEIKLDNISSHNAEGITSIDSNTTSAINQAVGDAVSSTVDKVQTQDDISKLDLNQTTIPKSITYSVAEQIDLKMKELMSFQESYADSTTDYTSSEETFPNSVVDVTKKKSLKKHTGSSYLNSELDLPEGLSSKSKYKGQVSKVASDVSEKLPEFKCQYCSLEVAPACFACGKEVSSKNESLRQRCSVNKCGRFYHPSCVKLCPQTQWSLISTIKHKDSDKDLETFVCPSHVCHTCSSDNPRSHVSRCRSDQVVKCLQCPATYHSTNYCVPAGTEILSTTQIMCPRHFTTNIPKKGKGFKNTNTVNTSWCFICSEGGNLVCCETCPTSIHPECLHLNLVEDGTFICEDCESGRFPLYDEIVWVKLGKYRWWPGAILFPSEVPLNIEKLEHNKGDFVVKFFGTHDHYWVNRGRVFLFQEGDRAQSARVKTAVDISFKRSVTEAAEVHQLKNAFALTMKAEIQTENKPPPYIRVKINKPVGNVKIFDPNLSNTTPCECSPTHPNPCGPESDCLNRILLIECDPNICPAKDKCNNQRFEKRQYPNLVPYKTESRGWGLKTLVPIRKGEFVIEYVGELIDEAEYQRRIHKMHEQKDENYYFLTIDKDRIIDAGPKGNMARFMNHCCEPNCATQKWTVNGDTRVGLFALKDIPADSEVTFNYKLQCIGKEKKICACGASNCCGFIGGKTKLDESQKKIKKNAIKRKQGFPTPPISKNDGPCFICSKPGDVGACQNKICTKYFHLQCVKLKEWPEGKWVCPWHNCNICAKRTIRCCVKCINSYCPIHSDSNIRHDKLLGFVCSEHDPAKESQEILNQSSTPLKTPNIITAVHTEENDVTSTTIDDCSEQSESNKTSLEENNHTSLEIATSTPNRKKNYSNFVKTLETFEDGFTPSDFKNSSIKQEQKSKQKRIYQKKSVCNTSKKIKLSADIIKPTPTYSSPSILDIPAQHEVKLSTTVPSRHLRTTRKVSTAESEIKQLIKRQSEYEKDLPIRKRTTPRCELTP